jgi:Ca2+-binding EF-hand superfamily protein
MRASLAAVLLLGAGAGLAQTQGDYFSRIDGNGDGRVSLAEFHEHMGFAFRQMDVNGDGVLEPQEQLVPDAKPITLAEHQQRLTAQFQRQDTNGDGYLSRAELLAPPRR